MAVLASTLRLEKQPELLGFSIHYYLLAQFRQDNPGFGIVDFKAYCRGFRYVREMLKMLPQQPESILLAQSQAYLSRSYSQSFYSR